MPKGAAQREVAATRVLICDDVAELRSAYRVWLSAERDIDVVGEAANGNEAVAMTRELLPDVVLLDIQMPEKDGMQALEEIARDHPDTKVVMMTGLVDARLEHRALQLGAADFIKKGTDFKDLADRIRAATSKS
ncbi:MAG: hypothetical protein QOG16_1629 [Actinomycetota bacterium]|jgi:DNA-binding NarL/FixJ family response regulator|nr:hypothetical protein [Actinomycetota bacterium]